MIRFLVKLAIVALLANAGYRIAVEYLTYVQFRDAVRDAAMFKAKNDNELNEWIMNLAGDYDVPLEADAVSIRREDRVIYLEGRYQKPIEVAPRVVYPWQFSWSMQVIASSVVPPYTPRR